MTDVLKNLIGSEETPKMSGSAGYHGGIVGEVPEVQLQKCSDFKVDFDPNLYKLSDIKNDPATQLTDLRQSLGVGAYYLDNMYSCQCGLENARSIQTSQPAISFDAGVDYSYLTTSIKQVTKTVEVDTDVSFDASFSYGWTWNNRFGFETRQHLSTSNAFLDGETGDTTFSFTNSFTVLK